MHETRHIVDTSPKLTWRAVYKDSTVLNQYNPDGTKNRYNDIDREDLVQFMLLNAEGKPVVIIHLDEKKKLIWRMRVEVKLSKGISQRVHLVGWQENRRGVNVQMICAIFPDGHIEIVDRFRENHPWFYSVKFREAEKLE